MKGTVKWFNYHLGYGFIIPENGGKEVFVHHAHIVAKGFRRLDSGDVVTYDTAEGPNGLMAVNVVKELIQL